MTTCLKETRSLCTGTSVKFVGAELKFVLHFLRVYSKRSYKFYLRNKTQYNKSRLITQKNISFREFYSIHFDTK